MTPPTPPPAAPWGTATTSTTGAGATSSAGNAVTMTARGRGTTAAVTTGATGKVLGGVCVMPQPASGGPQPCHASLPAAGTGTVGGNAGAGASTGITTGRAGNASRPLAMSSVPPRNACAATGE